MVWGATSSCRGRERDEYLLYLQLFDARLACVLVCEVYTGLARKGGERGSTTLPYDTAAFSIAHRLIL